MKIWCQYRSEALETNTSMIYFIVFVALTPLIFLFFICLQICERRNDNSRPQNQEQLKLEELALDAQLYHLNII